MNRPAAACWLVSLVAVVVLVALQPAVAGEAALPFVPRGAAGAVTQPAWHQGLVRVQAAPDPYILFLRARAQEMALQAQQERRRLNRLYADYFLHGMGSQLYTAWNAPITLKAINWYGFEYAPFVPDGLDRAPLDEILYTVRNLGFNALRLTFADQTVRQNPVVTQGLDANPEFRGLHALDIMQRIIVRAHHFGMRVILCDSRSEAGRGPETATGLWYTKQYPDAVWRADWIELVKRFRNDSAFVGADLRNEPHDVGSGSVRLSTYLNDGPLWGAYKGKYYPARDWHYAAQTLGNTLLSINPHLLIIVEGVQIYLDPVTGKVLGGLWGSNLEGVQYDPIQLSRRSQLVYSVHEYGPLMWQGDWFNPRTTYASLEKRWNRLWGYLLNASAYLQAPIFVGEFGTCHDYWSCISSSNAWTQGFWFKSFIQYLQAHPQVGWAYWALNPTGPYQPQDPNYYSLFSTDWQHYYPLLVRGLAPLLAEPNGTITPAVSQSLKIFLPVPGCSSLGSCIPQPPPAARFQLKIVRNVPYVLPANPFRMGDLYLPQEAGRALRPAVIVVHGGSWDDGSKGTPGTVALARPIAQRGDVAFDINYRLLGHDGQYPNSIQDVEDAVAYLVTHQKQLQIDPQKIAVVGASAGGYLALMAAYRAGITPFAPAIHVPIHIRAVGSFFAPVELKATVLAAGKLPQVQKLAAFLGVRFAQNPLRYRAASPLRYTETAVPTAIWYGEADPMTPFRQTFELYKRLKQRRLHAELYRLPGAPRTITQLSASSRATVVAQLLQYLKGVFTDPAAR